MRIDELQTLPVFAGLTPEQLARPAEHFEPANYPAGAQIFAAGDRASRLYVVRSGEVVIRYHPYDGGSLDIATVQAGGAFGWSAAFRRSYYTSTAICRTEVMAITIQAHHLHHIMADDPQFASVLLERASQSASSRFDGLGQQVIKILKPKIRQS